MIVDCVLFAGEADMLECRLTELEATVDRFVIVEASETFQGASRALTFDVDRFSRWPIVYVTTGLVGADAWQREASQREAMRQGLDGVPDDALVVVSDVDEIWRADTDLAIVDGPILVLELAMYVYHFGLRHPDEWSGPVVTLKSTLDQMGDEPFQTLRGCRLHPRPPRAQGAGWHLSWFGGVEACQTKLGSFSHVEYAGTDIGQRIVDGCHVDGTPLIPVTTRDVPRWVRDGHAPEVWL